MPRSTTPARGRRSPGKAGWTQPCERGPPRRAPRTRPGPLTLGVEEADGQELLLGALIGKVGMGIPDPGTVAACVRLQLHHRRDWREKPHEDRMAARPAPTPTPKGPTRAKAWLGLRQPGPDKGLWVWILPKPLKTPCPLKSRTVLNKPGQLVVTTGRPSSPGGARNSHTSPAPDQQMPFSDQVCFFPGCL